MVCEGHLRARAFLLPDLCGAFRVFRSFAARGMAAIELYEGAAPCLPFCAHGALVLIPVWSSSCFGFFLGLVDCR